ncbi:unnamed protein product [Bubo scandiacus]
MGTVAAGVLRVSLKNLLLPPLAPHTPWGSLGMGRCCPALSQLDRGTGRGKRSSSSSGASSPGYVGCVGPAAQRGSSARAQPSASSAQRGAMAAPERSGTAHTRVHMHVRTHAHRSAAHTHVHTYVCTHTHTGTHMYVHTHARHRAARTRHPRSPHPAHPCTQCTPPPPAPQHPSIVSSSDTAAPALARLPYLRDTERVCVRVQRGAGERAKGTPRPPPNGAKGNRRPPSTRVCDKRPRPKRANGASPARRGSHEGPAGSHTRVRAHLCRVTRLM